MQIFHVYHLPEFWTVMSHCIITIITSENAFRTNKFRTCRVVGVFFLLLKLLVWNKNRFLVWNKNGFLKTTNTLIFVSNANLSLIVTYMLIDVNLISCDSELHNVIFVTRIKIWVQNFTQKTRKSRLFVFTTKHVNPLLFGLTAEVSGVKLSQLNGFLNKDLHSVKNAYVSPKKFTPDLQIFYTFPVFGLNVCSCWG